ncbi:hypothetical protein PR003_g26056 [Phytophthora rubi]|uniref:Uncharacterized protein n=1 Tax=Phytophthora rubi TaxID=129364 RepID=A0A6A4CA61_9STRA|nr:hypothetical protein PR002_g28474 [Phytophthora rubi]KAE9020040.1 hypothetical protein PR001_g13715 [Phytophthora rubi]KAE9287425.1 hypothetical protein PR003_g26056 [Phytophthora rubi]
MDSQREWNALETKYATPPVPDAPRPAVKPIVLKHGRVCKSDRSAGVSKRKRLLPSQSVGYLTSS